jgi:hypothetical protein
MSTRNPLQKSNNKRNFNPNFQKSNGVKRNYYSNNAQNYNSNNSRNHNNNGFYRNNNQNCSQSDNFRFKSKIQCWSCGNTGHKSNECRTKSCENYANNRSVETNNGNEDNNVGNIVVTNVNSINTNTLMLIDVKINDKYFKALVDSGSEETLIRKSVVEDLELKIIPYIGPKLEAVNKAIVETYGRVRAKIEVENHKKKRFYD